MRRLLVLMLVGAVLPVALAVDLEFPSEDSWYTSPYGSGYLGPGGGGWFYIEGTDLKETFTGTGLSAATDSHWVFTMDDYTADGVVNGFDVEINGVKIGSFSFTGSGSQQFHEMDLTFSHAAIPGPDYTLRMVATTTVPPGLSSWNWVAGGTVTLTPEPGSLSLLALGGLALLRRR